MSLGTAVRVNPGVYVSVVYVTYDPNYPALTTVSLNGAGATAWNPVRVVEMQATDSIGQTG